jgi:hypothetical protein
MKKARRNIRMQQRVTQKHTMKQVVVAGSLFSLIIAALFYFNFSRNTDSFADKKTSDFKPDLRTTTIEVPSRLLRSNETSQRINTNKFEEGHKRTLISRSTDEITISMSKEGGEE